MESAASTSLDTSTATIDLTGEMDVFTDSSFLDLTLATDTSIMSLPGALGFSRSRPIDLMDPVQLPPEAVKCAGPQNPSELPQYFVLADGVAPDVDLLIWWFGVRSELPTWFGKVLPEAVRMQPTSATAERLFSMMEWMHRDDRQSALLDYKETALMLRYNQKQRERNAPARLVVID